MYIKKCPSQNAAKPLASSGRCGTVGSMARRKIAGNEKGVLKIAEKNKKGGNVMKRVVCVLAVVVMLVGMVGMATAEVITIDTKKATVEEIAEAITKLKELLILMNGGYEPGLTLENYNRIETGMTYNMVVALFGEPGEVQMEFDMGGPEYKTVNYQWGAGFEYCAITFQGGKVAMKMQIGLK